MLLFRVQIQRLIFAQYQYDFTNNVSYVAYPMAVMFLQMLDLYDAAADNVLNLDHLIVRQNYCNDRFFIITSHMSTQLINEDYTYIHIRFQ